MTLIPFGFYMRMTEMPAIVVLGLWFVLQFLSGLVGDGAGGGVAWWAHIGGFVFGVGLAFLFGRRRSPSQVRWSA